MTGCYLQGCQGKLKLELTSQVVTCKFVSIAKRYEFLYHYEAALHNVTTAMLVSMLVSQTNPVGIELFICEHFLLFQ